MLITVKLSAKIFNLDFWKVSLLIYWSIWMNFGKQTLCTIYCLIYRPQTLNTVKINWELYLKIWNMISLFAHQTTFSSKLHPLIFYFNFTYISGKNGNLGFPTQIWNVRHQTINYLHRTNNSSKEYNSSFKKLV